LQDANRQQEHNVIVLVDFAVALMAILDQINRESFQRFKLRMGEKVFYCMYYRYAMANKRLLQKLKLKIILTERHVSISTI
jgi:hypothetical protein